MEKELINLHDPKLPYVGMNSSAHMGEQLLNIGAVTLRPEDPFTWASGWKSPIYCDNRKILSYPNVRNSFKQMIMDVIWKKYPHVDCIAGVATGAIALGAIVADAINRPFIYIRPKPKDHGKENQIEGDLEPGSRVVIVEDLVSTGTSSLKAREAVINAGGDVLGMVANFSYQFPVARESFIQAGCELWLLTDYPTLLPLAVKRGTIAKEQLPMLEKWREDPETWGK